MDPTTYRSRSWNTVSHRLVALWCAVLLVPGESLFRAQEAAPAPAGTAEPAEPKIPPEQLDALVAPIALYPDPLLAQTLVASTYPLEIVQLHQWLAKNTQLKDEKAVADAVAKEPWDTSIQSMAAVPDVVKRLADDIQWTTELGNAFLAQQSDVMDAVQRMRAKAKSNGALESNQQQKVETKVIEEKTVIVVESSNPEVIYVPSYSPTVVYGAPIYPYPPIYYPPYPPGAAFVSFSFGVAMGAAIWGGSCCGCGWGGNNVNINVNNNFNQINHNRVGGAGGAGNNNWQHNPSHRGAAPYSNKATANKYGGSTRGQSASGNRAAPTQQASGANRGAGGGGAGGGAGVSDRSAGSSSRGSTAGPSTSDRGGGSSSRGAGASSNQVGSRDMPSSSASSRSGGGGFGGDSGGFSGNSARSSSSRGASSMGSRGGGGGGRRR